MTADPSVWTIALLALAVNALIAGSVWLYSRRHDDVSIVDAWWSVLILVPGLVAFALWPSSGPRAAAVLALAALWAIRLAAHIAVRNHGKPEDPRYQAIRARNQPGFRFKSLYLVFLMQAVLAWLVSTPLLAAVVGDEPLGNAGRAGLLLAAAGLVIEALADAQLNRFRADASSRGKVLDSGLWRFSRHPNYFGEFCVWWGLFLAAWSAGWGWTVVSPLVMSVLLLKVSGVALLERDIGERRPAYREYIARTPAFFPWWPKP